jgi:hypothetical protein
MIDIAPQMRHRELFDASQISVNINNSISSATQNSVKEPVDRIGIEGNIGSQFSDESCNTHRS